MKLQQKSISAKASSNAPLANAYVTDDPASTTAVLAAVNLNGRLEKEREDALAKKTRGPVAVIVGPGDSGKSTLARMLCSYAARRGKRPIMIDLDPGQNDIGPPGVVGAATVDVDSISVEEGLSSSGALVYFYGHPTPSEAPELYEKCIDRLIASVHARFEVDPASKASGCIVDTCGWVEGLGYKLTLSIIKKLNADVVLVMGQDRLLNDLKRDLQQTKTSVVKLPPSGGASARNQVYRKKTRDRRIRQYFYGTKIGAGALTPATVTVSFDDVVILRAANKDDIADESMRPIGRTSMLDLNMPRAVDPTQLLQQSLLGVSHAKEESDALTCNVAGFVHVQSVDVDARQLTLLCPMPGPLPGKFLIMGGVKWVEQA